MAIINNAHAGSQVNLLCLLYRVLFRNDCKLSVEEVEAICCPPSLPTKTDQKKRLPENLRFWMQDEHQLWRENAEQKLELTRVVHSDSPRDIAVVTNEALFAVDIDDLFGTDRYQTEGLFRSLGCLLASDQFLVSSPARITNMSLDEFFNDQLPSYIPNNSEKPTINQYGHFLGYLECCGKNEYVVDPTRAIRDSLPYVFSDSDTLAISEFLRRLSLRLPILDGGKYRGQIERKMEGHCSADPSTRKLSGSMGYALSRLVAAGVLRLPTAKSDDVDAFTIESGGTARRISTVVYPAMAARI